jgi:hypothetical protein
MDLMPNNPITDQGLRRCSSFSWIVWNHLLYVLGCLDCDLSQAKGSNDADPIDEGTCTAWADALDAALAAGRIVVYSKRDERFEGGVRDVLLVKKEWNTDPPPLHADYTNELTLAGDSEQQDWIDWLLGVARFLRASGGVIQI